MLPIDRVFSKPGKQIPNMKVEWQKCKVLIFFWGPIIFHMRTAGVGFLSCQLTDLEFSIDQFSNVKLSSVEYSSNLLGVTIRWVGLGLGRACVFCHDSGLVLVLVECLSLSATWSWYRSLPYSDSIQGFLWNLVLPL